MVDFFAGVPAGGNLTLSQGCKSSGFSGILSVWIVSATLFGMRSTEKVHGGFL